VAADAEPAAKRLAGLLSMLLDSEVPEAFINVRTPLRLAVDATLGTGLGGEAKGPGPASDDSYPTVIVADGTSGDRRLRLTARTAGPLAGWRDQGAHLEARLTGPRPLEVARWLIGGREDDQAATAAAGEGARSANGGALSPATVLLSAVGVPTRDMKAVAHFDADDLLDVDFSGAVRVVTGGPLGAQWSGTLGINRADTHVLSNLFWPPFADRMARMPVKGSIDVAGGTGDVTIKTTRLQLAGSRLRGEVEVSKAGAWTGRLAVSKAPLGGLAGFLLDGDGTAAREAGSGAGDAAVPAAPWPAERFDFSHFAGLSADLQLGLDRLVDTSGATIARDVSTRLQLTDERVALNDVRARLNQGQLAGRAELVRTPAGTAFSSRIGGSGLSLAAFAPGNETAGRLGGNADLTAKIAGRALTPAALSGVLKGSGRLVLRNARVPGLSGNAITDLVRKVIAGEEEPDGLGDRLTELARVSAIDLGGPTLEFEIRNGIVNLPTMVLGEALGSARNATVVSLRDWRFESRWSVRPAKLPKPEAEGETLNLPPLTLIYAGALDDLDQLAPEISLGDLEREIVVAKMEANVARLERLRREDEERARQEAERQRLREEMERQAREAERLRIERERAEGLRPGGEGGWQSRVKPERSPAIEPPQRPIPTPRPL
jgi:uncharacterized protein (DUF4415 family)